MACAAMLKVVDGAFEYDEELTAPNEGIFRCSEEASAPFEP